MKVEIKKNTKFVMILTEDEAMWLKDITQNPFHGLSYTDENGKDAKMRLSFWHTIDNAQMEYLSDV